jgi:hypothetical protein
VKQVGTDNPGTVHLEASSDKVTSLIHYEVDQRYLEEESNAALLVQVSDDFVSILVLE